MAGVGAKREKRVWAVGCGRVLRRRRGGRGAEGGQLVKPKFEQMWRWSGRGALQTFELDEPRGQRHSSCTRFKGHKTTYCITIARVSTYLVGIGRLVDRHFLCFHREDEEITQTHIHGALKSDLTRFSRMRTRDCASGSGRLPLGLQSSCRDPVWGTVPYCNVGLGTGNSPAVRGDGIKRADGGGRCCDGQCCSCRHPDGAERRVIGRDGSRRRSRRQWHRWGRRYQWHRRQRAKTSVKKTSSV